MIGCFERTYRGLKSGSAYNPYEQFRDALNATMLDKVRCEGFYSNVRAFFLKNYSIEA